MQNQTQVVVIGAGIVGCSVVYHLTQMGWRDIVVLEQGPLFETGGSTSHAPGGVFQTNFSKMMTEFARYTVQLYTDLELEGQPCFYPVGGMEVAYTEARWKDLKRKAGVARSWEVEAALITPREAKDKIPLLDAKKIHGAYYVPTDGIARAVRAGEAMARAAQACGATFYGQTAVTGIEVENGRMQAVLTSRGRIATEQVLVCAGIWGPLIGRMAGVSIPLTPVQHQYTITSPLPELAGETREVVHPVLRHQDYAMYFRQHADCYGIGSYKHEPLLVDASDILSHDKAEVMPSLLAFTPQHFEAAHAAAIDLLPPLRNAELVYKINGMFSFTPDGMPVLGESLEVRGLWVAEAVWITHAGGVGRAVAEWMVDGTPAMDLHEADINRFPAHALMPSYIKIRGAQQYREVYDIIHPLQQIENPRQLRLSPFYPRQQVLGATFFENAGWEQPHWFEANKDLAQDPSWPTRSGWEALNWSPLQGGEHRATREGVALYDLSAFTKIEVKGPGALAFLQYIAVNQIDQPVGKIIYTSMLNKNGGIQCDLTITRLGSDLFLVLAGGATGLRDLAWMRLQAPADGSVQITDITSNYCGLGLWGPRGRDVLQQVCDNDISNQAFPYFTAGRLTIDLVPALALRLSYVGELGWEIYTPTEYGLRLWDILWEAGLSSGMIALGGGAFDSLRLEKGYRLWGADIHTEYTPYEAGLAWMVDFNKGDFLGREALLRIQAQGVSRKLCCMTLDDPDAVILGKEPIFADGRVLGYVTSTNRGYTVDKHIAYGYLPVPYARQGTRVEVEYFGERYKATVVKEPLYDPERRRMT
ncbi:MAG: FAD-dependent oxidoreductase [bacterium]|nr:FAD-dependent oxidoreductase [bacterium]